MFGRKYWIGLTVFLVAIVGVSLYYLQTRPPKDPILIIKPVEPLPKSTEQPKAEVPVDDTSQDGHFHADGTWHEGPHEPVEQPPPAAVSSLSDAELEAIPEDMPKPDIPLPTDLKNMDWEQWSQNQTAAWDRYIYPAKQKMEELRREYNRLAANFPAENSPDYTAAKARYTAVISAASRVGDEYDRRVNQARAARQAAREKYRLARFEKK